MDATIRPFARTINEAQMVLLRATAASSEGVWLREALGDSELFFTLRKERVDVYYRGQVIYSIDLKSARLTPRTHVKYLVVDGRDPYIKMQNGVFNYQHSHLQSEYKEGISLGQIKSAAGKYSTVESKGIYAVINRDPLVIDVEIAFNNNNEVAEHNPSASLRTQDRVDMVRLTPSKEGIDLVFWEAKHLSNKELFKEKIFDQLAAYARQLQSRQGELAAAFRNVCHFHRDLDRVRKGLGFAGASDSHLELLEGVASGRLPLRIVKEPSLFVFGFDNDQKEGRWKARRTQIEEVIGRERLRAVGNASDF